MDASLQDLNPNEKAKFMKTSPRGIEDLMLSEGVKLKAYKDSVGVWTIGVGHAATSGRAPIPRPGMTIDMAEAKRILTSDLVYYETDVNAMLPNVPQHVFDGAVSFHFNTGAIRRASWVRTYKKGDMEAARKAFLMWNKPKEIIGRRTREADLIFKGVYRSKPVASPATVPTPPPPVLPVPDPLQPDMPDGETVTLWGLIKKLLGW